MSKALQLLTGAVESAGVRVVAETNVTPAVVLYDAADKSPSLLDMLGVRVYARVETADGKLITSYGEPVRFDPIAAVLSAAVIVSLSLLASAIVLRIIK